MNTTQTLFSELICLFTRFRKKICLLISLFFIVNLITAQEPVNKDTRHSSQKKEIASLRLKAKKLIFTSNDSSIILYKKALGLSEKLQDNEEKALTMRDIGQFYVMIGSFDEAIDTLEKAWEIAREGNLTKLIGEIKSNIGVAYEYKGDYEKAIDCYSKALDDFILYKDTFSMAVVYLNIGIVYEEMSKADEAIEYYNKSLEFSKIINDKENIAVALNNLGVVYMDLKNEYTKALDYYEQALVLFNEMHQRRGISNIHNNMGEIYESQNNYKLAIESYKKALALNEENDEKQGIANSLRNLGKVYFKTKKYNEALSMLFKGIEIADEIDYKKAQFEIFGVITDVYDAQGMFEEAFKYNKLYYNLKDTIMNESTQEKMMEFQTRYETEKKNSEIARLKLDKMEQLSKIRNQRLMNYSLILGFIIVSAFVFILLYNYNLKKKANKEKEVLIKEIHHRVKNNLQTISSLLSLQNNYIVNNEIKDIVKESQSRVKSMALIHQLLYQQEDVSKIDFEKYLIQLFQAISSIYSQANKKIECTIHCENIFLDIDTAIPVGLIANELFVNAFKHAFCGDEKDGLITVQMSKQPDKKFIFKFKDNGIGLPLTINIENSNTLGLKLVNILVRQIKGELSYHTIDGTEFKIIFDDIVKKAQ